VVHESLLSTIASFSEKRASNVSHLFLRPLLERQPSLLWPLTDKLCLYATNPDIRVFCRTQVCSMLVSMITKKTVQEIGEQAWHSFVSKIVAQICEFIVGADKTLLKPKYLEELLRLLTKVLCSIEDSLLLQKIVPGGFTQKVEELRIINRDVRKQCNQLCAVLVARCKDPTDVSKAGTDKTTEKVCNGSIIKAKDSAALASSDSDEYEDALDDLSEANHSAKRRKLSLSGGGRVASSNDSFTRNNSDKSPAERKRKGSANVLAKEEA